MLKYVPQDTQVTFSEIPDEITLCINLSGCPHCCPGCHSPYLRNNEGEELTEEVVKDLLAGNKGISCVCFMGGDAAKQELEKLASSIDGIKKAWYSGENELNIQKYGLVFDYIKVGPYVESFGPLNSPTTNQRLYKIDRTSDQLIITDITNKFWKRSFK